MTDAENFQKLFNAAPKGAGPMAGDVVTGVISEIDHDGMRALVGVGDASYPLPFAECLDATTAVGDSIEGLLVTTADGLSFSPRLGVRARAWERVTKAQQTQEALTTCVLYSVLGGWSVDLGGGLEGFLPDSLVGQTTLVPGVPIAVFVGSWDRDREHVVVGVRPVHAVQRS